MERGRIDDDEDEDDDDDDGAGRGRVEPREEERRPAKGLGARVNVIDILPGISLAFINVPFYWTVSRERAIAGSIPS